MTKQALRPEFFAKLPSFQKDADAKKGGATDEEQQLYTLSRSKGWRVWSEYLNRIMGELDDMNANAIANGAGFEEIGQNAIIINSTKAIIKRAFAKVDDAAEACEKAIKDGK